MENAQQGYRRKSKTDAEQNKLIWLTPAPVKSTPGPSPRQSGGEKTNHFLLVEFERYSKRGRPSGSPAEFIERADGSTRALKKLHDLNRQT